MTAPANAALVRIAETLGCSIDDLTKSPDDRPECRGLSELIAIWTAMTSDADRDRLLAFARQLARV